MVGGRCPTATMAQTVGPPPSAGPAAMHGREGAHGVHFAGFAPLHEGCVQRHQVPGVERPSRQARIGSTGQSLALAVTSNERKQVARANLAEATMAASKVPIVSLQPYRANRRSQSRRNRFQFTGSWHPRSSSPLTGPDFIAAVAKAADLRLPLEVFFPVNGRWSERPLDGLVGPGVAVLNSQKLLLSPQRAPASIPSASAVSAASCSILQERAEEAERQV
jgi:hypothetical protein